MPARRRISAERGRSALHELSQLPQFQPADATKQPSLPPSLDEQVATAVRYLLEELAARHPGRLVEVRVAPWGAVQCAPPSENHGPGELGVHTRGTPAHVVQADPWAWIMVAVGRVGWQQMVDACLITASGHRADLSTALPLLDLPGGTPA